MKILTLLKKKNIRWNLDFSRNKKILSKCLNHFETLAKKIYETVRGWAPLRCSLQSVPPPAADNQGVVGEWGRAGAVGDLARGLYSPLLCPATSTSLYSVVPTWRSMPFFSFLLSILSSLFLSAISKFFPLDAFVYQLPAKVTEQQLSFTNCDLVGTLHSTYIAIFIVLPFIVSFRN